MIVLKKSSIVKLVLAILLAVTFVVAVPLSVTAFANQSQKGFVFVVDAGHGGADGGVQGTVSGVKESELNLQVAKKLEKLFVDGGHRVVMTRKNANWAGGDGVSCKKDDFQKRMEIVKETNPDAMISVHMNFFSASYRRGAQVFFDATNQTTKNLACLTQKRLNENLNAKYNGRSFSALTGDYFMLKCSNVPSIIVECGFLSNPIDEKLLMTESYQNEIAYEIFSSVLSWKIDGYFQE